MRRRFLSGNPIGKRGAPDISWYGAKAEPPNWHDPRAQVLGFTLAGVGEQEADLHVLLNMAPSPLETLLPPVVGRRWQLAVDTSRESPDDIVPAAAQQPVEKAAISVAARSVVVFESV
jgi:glycogen operon protein